MSEDEEEDWFERAMRETEEGSDSSGATADEGSGAEAEDDTATEAEDDETPETGAETDESDAGSEPAVEGEQDPFGGIAAAEEEEPDTDEEDPFGGIAVDEEGPGDESGEDEFGGGSEAGGSGGGPQGGFGEGPPEDGFGGDTEAGADGDSDEAAFGGAEQDPFGRGGSDSFGGGQSDPFGGGAGEGGFESGGKGDPFGGDQGFGGGGDGAPDFDEAELDSDIDRIDVGIEGLDEMILGGIPERSLMVTIGAAGTGKTTFALQFLTEALENDEKAVYITLEESREAILSTAEEKGWPFRRWHDEGQLAVVSMDPIEMANSLSSIRSDISRLVEEFGADRLVLDSVSLLEMMYDHPAKRRSEVFDFARSLKRAGVTTMLTSEASAEDSYTSRYGIIEYLVDAVFILQYVRPSDFRETRLAVEIQKIRDANHSRETKPYEITNDGISVYRQANIF